MLDKFKPAYIIHKENIWLKIEIMELKFWNLNYLKCVFIVKKDKMENV